MLQTKVTLNETGRWQVKLLAMVGEGKLADVDWFIMKGNISNIGSVKIVGE